jgi:hypothetical protein
VITNPAENLETLRRHAGELEPKLAGLEDALLGLEHLRHGPQFLREQLRAAAAFQSAGDSGREQLSYLKASLAFDLLETQILAYK